MNLRTYLRLYHPLPALLSLLLFTNGAAGFGQLLFRLNRADAWLLALLVALPLLLGCDLAGAAHMAEHRPFALLLPDLTRKLLRATVWAGLILVLAVTLTVGRVYPAIPLPAVFGLAAALLAIPMLDRHRLVARSKLFHVAVNVAGLQFRVMGFAGWVLFMGLAGRHLVPAMIAVPWLFFVGGLGVAAGILPLAFARRALRERADIPYLSQNAAWLALFNARVMTRHRGECRRHIVQFGAGGGRRSLGMPAGRDWDVRAVGPRTRDWLRVMWHGTYGIMRRGSFLRVQALLLGACLVIAFAVPLTGFVAALKDSRPFGFAGYVDVLAALGTAEIDTLGSTQKAVAAMIAILVHLGFTFALTLGGRLTPQLPYPLSRGRMARVTFTHALLQMGFALAIPTLALQLAALIGQALSGRYLPLLGVVPLLRLDLVFASVLPLVAAVAWVRRRALQLPIIIALALLGCGLEVSRPWLAELFLRPDAILGVVLLAAGALLLLRVKIRRHFQACDLVAEAARASTYVSGVRLTVSVTASATS